MLTVLIVDDDPALLDALPDTIRLRTKDLRVITASSVREGLAVAQHEQPEIVLTDLVMPGENGEWLVEQLLSYQPPPVTLLMTAHPNAKGLEQKYKDLQFIAKPIDRDYLGATLQRAAHKARLRRRARRVHTVSEARAKEARRVLRVSEEQAARIRAQIRAFREARDVQDSSSLI